MAEGRAPKFLGLVAAFKEACELSIRSPVDSNVFQGGLIDSGAIGRERRFVRQIAQEHRFATPATPDDDARFTGVAPLADIELWWNDEPVPDVESKFLGSVGRERASEVE